MDRRGHRRGDGAGRHGHQLRGPRIPARDQAVRLNEQLQAALDFHGSSSSRRKSIIAGERRRLAEQRSSSCAATPEATTSCLRAVATAVVEAGFRPEPRDRPGAGSRSSPAAAIGSSVRPVIGGHEEHSAERGQRLVGRVRSDAHPTASVERILRFRRDGWRTEMRRIRRRSMSSRWSADSSPSTVRSMTWPPVAIGDLETLGVSERLVRTPEASGPSERPYENCRASSNQREEVGHRPADPVQLDHGSRAAPSCVGSSGGGDAHPPRRRRHLAEVEDHRPRTGAR